MRKNLAIVIGFGFLWLTACSKKAVFTAGPPEPGQAAAPPGGRSEPTAREAYVKPETATYDRHFTAALSEMETMLQYPEKLRFKRAVFLTENAYCNDTLNYEAFNRELEALAQLCRLSAKANRLRYPFDDSVKVAKYAAAFKLITEGFVLIQDSSRVAFMPPYAYDFEDYAGNRNWANMFVTKLLATHKGNCHSLPFLYKIVVEELGETAHLALAPNHIYIKHQIKQAGWYNSELTSCLMYSKSS